jgi:hypothetical protein
MRHVGEQAVSKGQFKYLGNIERHQRGSEKGEQVILLQVA